jgi:hypothetical protein
MRILSYRFSTGIWKVIDASKSKDEVLADSLAALRREDGLGIFLALVLDNTHQMCYIGAINATPCSEEQRMPLKS